MKAIAKNIPDIDMPAAIISAVSAAASTIPSESMMFSEAITRAMCDSGVIRCIIAYIGTL